MATREYSRLALCWWILCQLSGFQASEEFCLTTPQPDGTLPIRSCVFVLETVDIFDPSTGLVDDNFLSASLLSPTYTTQCSSTYSGFYQLTTEPDTQTVCTQLTGDGSTPFDAFLPIPSACLGRDYLTSTWVPGAAGTSFVAIFNPNGHQISVNISLGPNLNPSSVMVDGTAIGAGNEVVVEVLSGETKYVTSSDQALDGLDLSGSDDFGVMAGNWDSILLGFGQANHFLEMFPSKSFFSDEYLVPFPAGYVFYAVLKIVSLSEDSPVDVTVTQFSSSPTTVANTLTNLGDVWSYTQQYTVHIDSSGPVIVIQYLPDSSLSAASSMTLIPPVTKWVWSVVLYPLTSYSSTNGVHFTEISIKTAHTSGLSVYNLVDGTDVTSSLTFSPLGQSEYSEASLTLGPSDLFLIQHAQFQTFQVMQYGGSDDIDGLYAFPVSMNTSCQQTTPLTSSTPSSLPTSTDLTSNPTIANGTVIPRAGSTKSGTIYDFSDSLVYAIVAGIVFLVAMVIIIAVIYVRVTNKCRRTQTKVFDPPNQNKRVRNVRNKVNNVTHSAFQSEMKSLPKGSYPCVSSHNAKKKILVAPAKVTRVFYVKPSK